MRTGRGGRSVIAARAMRIGAGFGAAGLVTAAAFLPLWQMTMRAPQYPKGLRLYAFGSRMEGDLSELNILNHYIGMPAVVAPSLETSLFPIGIGLLILLCLAAPAHPWLRRAAIATAALMPIGILVDLQWRLYEFGHTLNPTAPIRLKPFTPLVIGSTEMGNFVSTAMVSWGVACLAAAPTGLLQARIDATPRGGTVVVPAGIHAGAIRIRGPLSVDAERGAIVDGGGTGSVVTISGDDVLFRGFM